MVKERKVLAGKKNHEQRHRDGNELGMVTNGILWPRRGSTLGRNGL